MGESGRLAATQALRAGPTCSMVSQVITQKVTGTPVSVEAPSSPPVAAFTTAS